MLTVNLVTGKDGKRITGSFNGEVYNIVHTDTILKSLRDAEDMYNLLENATDLPAWENNVKTILEVSKSLNTDIITENCEALVKRKGKYYIKGRGDSFLAFAIPSKLVDLIFLSLKMNEDPSPIIRAIINWFDRHPKRITVRKFQKFAEYITNTIVDKEYSKRLQKEEGYSKEAADEVATYYDVQITKHGLISSYKYAELKTAGYTIKRNEDGTTEPMLKEYFARKEDTIDEDTGVITQGKLIIPEHVDADNIEFTPPVMKLKGDAFYSREKLGHTIHVGSVIELLGRNESMSRAQRIEAGWEMVNEDDNSSCCPGLHVGGRQYVASYKDVGSHLLTCFVHPSQIGAVVSEGDGALRVRSYFTYGAVKKRTKSIYHESSYAAKCKDDWKAYRELIVKRVNTSDINTDL